MKKILSMALALAALAFSAATPARSAEVDNTFFLFPQFGSGLTINWQFNNLVTSGSSPTPVSPLLAGDTFVDDFIFNPPLDSTQISLSLVAGLINQAVSVSLSSVSLFAFQPGVPVSPIALDLFGDSSTLTGYSALPIDNGTYVFEIRGKALLDGGTFSGTLTGSVPDPVPEPASIVLLLVGLASVYAVRRRSGIRFKAS